MKKILCHITEEEAEEIGALISIWRTYVTLLDIAQNNADYKIDCEKLNDKEKQSKRNIKIWWERMSEIYEFPYYSDKIMHIDSQRNVIFIEE